MVRLSYIAFSACFVLCYVHCFITLAGSAAYLFINNLSNKLICLWYLNALH